MTLKLTISIVFILAFMALRIQMQNLKSNPDAIKMKYSNETNISNADLLDEIQSIKLAFKFYNYYNDLLEENAFNSESQKKKAEENLKMVQRRLLEFLAKYSKNRVLLFQAFQEYQKEENLI
jgi:hypothetical protein